MSNRELCLKLIDSFEENQLANVVTMLQSAKAMADEAADDAYCLRLWDESRKEAAGDEGMPLEDFAQSLGVSLQ